MTKTVTKNKVRSVEPLIADLANGWMKSYNLDYKLEQEPLNTEIDKALDEYLSKSGGKGGNRPDAKLLLQDKNLNYWPVLIEYKGYKGKLEKLDSCGGPHGSCRPSLPAPWKLRSVPSRRPPAPSGHPPFPPGRSGPWL